VVQHHCHLCHPCRHSQVWGQGLDLNRRSVCHLCHPFRHFQVWGQLDIHRRMVWHLCHHCHRSQVWGQGVDIHRRSVCHHCHLFHHLQVGLVIRCCSQRMPGHHIQETMLSQAHDLKSLACWAQLRRPGLRTRPEETDRWVRTWCRPSMTAGPEF